MHLKYSVYKYIYIIGGKIKFRFLKEIKSQAPDGGRRKGGKSADGAMNVIFFFSLSLRILIVAVINIRS